MEYMECAMQDKMTGEMAHNSKPTHDKAKAWIDKEVKFIDEIHPNGGNSKNVTSFWTNYRASLLANLAGLERHKPKQLGPIKYPNGTLYCSECFTDQGYDGASPVAFPCPTYTEIYDPIRPLFEGDKDE